MEIRDWSLVFFTVLTQAAVGMFFTFQAVQVLSRRFGGDAADGVVVTRQIVVFVLLSAGLSAALFHLSVPLEAVRAVVNVGSSWLSREIIFGGLFALFLGTLIARQWSGTEVSRGMKGITWLTGMAALAFLYCQIKIYLLPTQPSWNSIATPASFVATALRLGILGVAALLVTEGLEPLRSSEAKSGQGPGVSCLILRRLVLAGLLVLGTELVILPVQISSLVSADSSAAAASHHRLTVDYGFVLMVRLVLLCIASATLGWLLTTFRRIRSDRLLHTLAYVSFSLVFLSELCGRFLFYAIRVRVGI